MADIVATRSAVAFRSPSPLAADQMAVGNVSISPGSDERK
jgi:hypothetical protein